MTVSPDGFLSTSEFSSQEKKIQTCMTSMHPRFQSQNAKAIDLRWEVGVNMK